MKWYFLKLLVIALIAVTCAVYIARTPSLILIEMGDYTFAGSLWLLLLLLFALGMVFYLLWRFLSFILRFPGELKLFLFGSRASKIDRHFRELIVASIVENPYASRRHLLALTKLKSHPGLCALKAALLAIDHGQVLEYQENVEQAQKDPEVEPWMIRWVELRATLMQGGSHEKIESLIAELKKECAAESAIWPLELRYAQSIRDWKRASDAAYRLKSLKLMDASHFKSFTLECDVSELKDAKDLSMLNALWNEHSRGRKKELSMIEAFKQKRTQFQ